MANKEYAWKDQQTVVAGRPVGTLQSISYTANRAQEYLYGAGDDPIGIQSGNKEYLVELELLQSDIEALNLSAKANGGDDITDVRFDVINSLVKEITDPQVTDIIKGIAVESLPKSWNQGDPKMAIRLTGKALKIEYGV